MKVCIHRGTKEVGATCIEIESLSQRLILDLGYPLDHLHYDVTVPDIPGLISPEESLLGIIVSHAHLDHYGLLSAVQQHVPIFIGEGGRRIINTAAFFFPANGVVIENFIPLEDKVALSIGPFTVTPYLVDHSAYDSYAILVEANGKRLFYSGDIRGHGRKGKLLDRLVDNPPTEIDSLLLEGTTLSRTSDKVSYPTEEQLKQCFVKQINLTKGMVLVWAAAQNIDRLVTIYKACRQTGRLLIVDMYTAAVLKSIGNPNLPQPGYKQLKVFLPRSLKRIIRERKLFDFAKTFSQFRIYPEELQGVARNAVLFFRPSMAKDLEMAGCLEESSLIYSLWPGYLKEEKMGWFTGWLEQKQIPINHCHTSGHAPLTDLQRLAGSLNPKKLIPIHSFSPELYQEYFANVETKDDGEWWPV